MKKLRSQEWFSRKGKMGFIYRSWMKNQGFPDDAFEGKPVIGICNTWSELTPCNAHFRELAEVVKRGVYEAGGLPLEFPITSLGETNMRPTAMLFRNLAAMDAEETIRANPIDGVVLLVGCDKTTPSAVMGASSVNLPTIVVSGGAMLNGRFRGQTIGSGTDVWKFSEAVRAGTMSEEEMTEAEGCMSRSQGHCMTMGTASTMAVMCEALGLTLPGTSAIPASDSRKKRFAQLAGRRIVEMVNKDLKIADVVTRQSLENAIVVNAAVGGSTNMIVHLLAIAGRLGLPLTLDDFDAIGSNIPLLLNLQPSGEYLMEDFYYAGGLPAIINELTDTLHLDAKTVNGKTLGANNIGAPRYGDDVIFTRNEPLQEHAGIAVVKGNICQDGAVIKPSAATPGLMKHIGKAVVFENVDDLHARIDDPDLDVDETSILVLKNAGPKGYPGMPEVGNMPLPSKLLKKGVRDMVRISDGRMSGTAFGTVFLHVAPESAVGGALALVQDGDEIMVDVEARKLELKVSSEELERRRKEWKQPESPYHRGYVQMYVNHVMQADKGADLDFLTGSSGAEVPSDNH